ncbi:hypothetical protein MOQ13_20465 [Escherichia coli]|nr:hypothetical protein [Escherichia coli]MCR1044665.1 hypothetical protein [Escherichia coli]
MFSKLAQKSSIKAMF